MAKSGSCFLCCIAFPACAAFAQSKPVFSDDFASGQLDPKVWETRVTVAATIEVQQSETAHRRYTLRVQYPEMAPASYALAVLRALPETVKEHLLRRAYAKIVPGLPRSQTVMLWAGGAGWPISNSRRSASVRGRSSRRIRRTSRRAVKAGVRMSAAANPTTLAIWIDGQPSPVAEGGQKVDLSSSARRASVQCNKRNGAFL